jgi:hypothetical protein
MASLIRPEKKLKLNGTILLLNEWIGTQGEYERLVYQDQVSARFDTKNTICPRNTPKTRKGLEIFALGNSFRVHSQAARHGG